MARLDSDKNRVDVTRPPGATPVAILLWVAMATPLCAHADEWSAANRFIAAGAGQLRQSYREDDRDGLTTSDVLDAEHGTLSRVHASARWQGEAQGFPLLLQVRVERTRGASTYSGYIRYRDGLMPLLTTTGNVMRYDELLCGLPIHLGTEVQFTPLVGMTRWSWRRQLLAYTERYRDKGLLLGLITQHRLAAAVFEAQLVAGRTSAAHVEIDQDAWRAGLDPHWTLRAEGGVRIALGGRSTLGVFYGTERYQQRPSEATKGLVVPSSRTRQRWLDVRLAYDY